MGTAGPQEMLESHSQVGICTQTLSPLPAPLALPHLPSAGASIRLYFKAWLPRKQKLSRNAPKRQRTDITQQLSMLCLFWRTKQRQPLMWKLQLPESQAGPTAKAVFCNNTKVAFVTLILTKTLKPVTICLAKVAKSSECTTKLQLAVPTDTWGVDSIRPVLYPPFWQWQKVQTSSTEGSLLCLH